MNMQCYCEYFLKIRYQALGIKVLRPRPCIDALPEVAYVKKPEVVGKPVIVHQPTARAWRPNDNDNDNDNNDNFINKRNKRA